MTADDPKLKALPLAQAHAARGAKFGPFAGYQMPIQYAEGLISEHIWCRTQAGLFDVSHMGPALFTLDPAAAPADPHAAHEMAARLIERLVPADIVGLAPGQMRYTMLLNTAGGVIDDLMIARHPDPVARGVLYLVVNAAGKDADFALIEAAAQGAARLQRFPEASLLALQGPAAEAVLAAHAPQAAELGFMQVWAGDLMGAPAIISRSGYTGEDGFEILAPPEIAAQLCEALLNDARVKLIGLGARDSLRLEAGLCLYGHDLDETISPIEAGLAWTIQKRRRQGADFPGAERILRELKDGPSRLRVGLKPRERAPAREGVAVLAAGAPAGVITSGGFSPTLNAPISMGFLDTPIARAGGAVDLLVRDKPRPADIVPLPFVPHRYKR